MGIFEQMTELSGRDVIEEGRREGAKEATRGFIENLLKDSGFSLDKIALLADVSLETVKKIRIKVYIEKLAENKEKEILNECRAKEYREEYSIMYAKQYAKSYKVGLLDGMSIRHLVEGPEGIEPPGEIVM